MFFNFIPYDFLYILKLVLILLISIYFIWDYFNSFQISSFLFVLLSNFILIPFVLFFSFASLFINIFQRFHPLKLICLTIKFFFLKSIPWFNKLQVVNIKAGLEDLLEFSWFFFFFNLMFSPFFCFEVLLLLFLWFFFY